jgi:beta-lactamase regulating signal transducer with metallopeptidase domain
MIELLAQQVATGLVNSLPAGVGIALLAWGLLRAMGRQNSATRFAVWFAALAGIAALPLMHHSGVPAVAGAAAPWTLPVSWGTYIFVAWAIIATLALLRVASGFLHVRKLRATCAEVNREDLEPELQSLVDELSKQRSFRLCISAAVKVPTAIGFFHPSVILPAWTLRGLSAEQLRIAVLHESAHLRRGDDWTNLAQKILAAVFFFHPAVWWLDRRLSLEREMACDDAVLAETGNPRGYAECLVALAERSVLRRGFAMAQAAVSRLSEISARLKQILDPDRPSAKSGWRSTLVMAGALSAVCLFAGPHAPQLVGFADSGASAGRVAVLTPAQLSFTSAISPVKLDVPTATGVAAKTTRAPRPNHRPSSRADGRSAATVMAKAAAPVAIATGGVTAQESMLLVVEEAHFVRAADGVWRVQVWQLMLVHPQVTPDRAPKVI